MTLGLLQWDVLVIARGIQARSVNELTTPDTRERRFCGQRHEQCSAANARTLVSPKNTFINDFAASGSCEDTPW